jgi:hypothetical protein
MQEPSGALDHLDLVVEHNHYDYTDMVSQTKFSPSKADSGN